MGDGITTSYGARAYKVKAIHAPVKFEESLFHIVIRSQEVTSLVLSDEDGDGKTDSYINHIRVACADRWATDQNDEIFVEKRKIIAQPGLFEAQTAQPLHYPFQDGCDYRVGAGKVWRCPRCEKDFNSAEKHRLPFCCPVCLESRDRFLSTCTPIFFIESPPPGDWRPRPSQFLMTLNMEDYLPRKTEKIAAQAA